MNHLEQPLPPIRTIGVVIPVGNRSTTDLGPQLQALASQTWSGPVSVVISCNGEPVHLVEGLVATVDWPDGWSVTAIDSSAVRGPSAARNTGWRTLDTDVVLFCDADDVVADTWIAGLVQGLEHAGVCTGPMLLDALNEAWMTESSEQPWPIVRFGHLPHTCSANLGVRRVVLDLTDGFDTTLGAAEDTDFAWRATYAGFPTRFATAAVVQYRLRPRAADLFRNNRHYARWDRVLVDKHRAHGARWRRREVIRHVLSTAVAVVRAPFGRRRRRIAANRLGTLVGWAERYLGKRPTST